MVGGNVIDAREENKVGGMRRDGSDDFTLAATSSEVRVDKPHETRRVDAAHHHR